jgi:hypothetical protein
MDFLPFKHVQLYADEDAPDALLWVCRYCHFWCEIFDPLIMERHRSVCGGVEDVWTVLPSHHPTFNKDFISPSNCVREIVCPHKAAIYY